MATANPPVRFREDDNYEIELSRVREKIKTQFGSLTDRLKCRERELLEELDAILASYISYRDEFEIVRDKVRDLLMMKQRNEEELAASKFKKLQENIIKQIDEEIKSITYPKEPQLVNFVCESNVILSEIDQLGKLVKWVTERYEGLRGEALHEELDTQSSKPETSNILKSLASNFISTVLPSSPKTTDPYSSSKRQPTIPSYNFTTILADTTVNQSNDSIHFTDFVDGAFYHDFSTYSSHAFRLNGEYWKSVQHCFQAHKYSSSKWLMDKIRSADTSNGANEIGKDKAFMKQIVKNWDFTREDVMFIALKAKFRNHRSLKDTLLATGDRLIVNDSENEFWGRGKDGKGKNTLGMLLMRVRKESLNTDVSKSFLLSNYTYTYSHHTSPKTPSNDDVIEFYDKDKPYYEFTPYSRHSVCLDGISWGTLNHYFQAQKFTSNNEKKKIADTPTPERATFIANNELRKFSKIQTFDEKEKIMKIGLEAKLTQHPDLRRTLLATGTRKLLFIHPMDTFWGTGPKSLGQNKLGELLMYLRNKLQVQSPPTNPKYHPRNISYTN